MLCKFVTCRTGRCENINSMYGVYYLSRKGAYIIINHDVPASKS
jgi:hypothetical protein